VKGKAAGKAAAEPISAWTWVSRVVAMLVYLAAVPVILGLPIGRRLFWTVAIASVPLFFTVAGFYFWRRICPLAAFGQVGRIVGLPGKRKAGEWLAQRYPLVQLGILVTALALRLVATNGTPWALAGFLMALTLGAMVVSFLYTGKTWCNFICPVGIVEKLYTEPVQVARASANSQCATCTACKKHCPDIDVEQGYWKEADAPARRVAYFAWPGIVIGFYGWFWLCAGDWSYYFSGDWTRETEQVRLAMAPGFHFASFLPRVISAPLTLVACGALSFALFAWGERLALGEAPSKEEVGRVRHRALALAGFLGFLSFYFFAGQPTLAHLPWWAKRGFEALVVLTATIVLIRRWGRKEEDYVQEKFARGILRRWEWGDAPPSEDLGDIYLIHTERTKQREARLRAYKDTVRDLVADGVLSHGEFALLDKLRVQLGVSDKDHEKILGELSGEEKKLFDPAYRGSMEQRLQREQYKRDLERLVLYAAGEGRAPDAAALEDLQREHKVPDEEHTQALAALRDPNGPVAHKAREELDEMERLRRAVRRAREAEKAGASSTSVGFFAYLAGWRQDQHAERALSLLAVISHPPLVDEARKALKGGHGERRARAAEALQKIAGDALALRLATLLRDPVGDSAEADPAALLSELKDLSPYVRAAAAYVLSRFDDAESRGAVASAVSDEHPVVRETAIRALGARGRLTRELVLKALDDPDPRVSRAVVRAAGRDPSQTLDPDKMVQTTQGIGSSDPGHYATLDPKANVDTLTTLEKMMLLRNVPLFAVLEPDDLEVLTAIATERRVLPGQDLCREGEQSTEVFVIVKGHVRAWVKGAGAERVLGESTDGMCIGEMAALDEAPRSATVTTTAETRVLVLDGKEFKQLLIDRPAIARGVLGVLTARLRSMIAGARKA
jgi:hypothetical protein